MSLSIFDGKQKAMSVLYRWLVIPIFSLAFSPVFAWTAYGHFLVAQIAYDNLDPKTRDLIEKDNRALNQQGQQGIVQQSAWLDTLRAKTWRHHIKVLSQLHYIDLPYSPDHALPLSVKKMNVVLAIQLAQTMLENTETSAIDRAFAVRMLWHIVADIHQPMHCISRLSPQHPKGDFGGTRYALGVNSYGKTLHAYWDVGGGLLSGYKQNEVKQVAKILEKRWPCENQAYFINPKAWAKESYDLAVKVAYQIPEGEIPNMVYQEKVAEISAERIALAGCRLAAISKQVYMQYQSRRA